MAELKEELKILKQEHINKKGTIKGTWKLTYKLSNPNGVAGFTGRHLTGYPDRVTGKERHLFDMNGTLVPSFAINKQVEYFNPEKDPYHAEILDWLIGHPQVGLPGVKLGIPNGYYASKRTNPPITLINMDHEIVEDLEEEGFIDKLCGMISQDSGPNAISVKKIRMVLAKLDMQYYELKYLTEPAIESSKLRKKLKDFCRVSYENAKKVADIFDNLEDAKLELEIRELIRKELVTNNNGMFMYQNNPIGVGTESIKKRFRNDPDFYARLMEDLYGSN